MRKMKKTTLDWVEQIPAEWEIKKLKYCFAFGKGLSITKDNLEESGISVISYGQIHSKQNKGTAVHESLIRFVNESYLRTDISALVRKNDFIFADTSEDLEGCGNCVYNDYDGKLFAGYHTIIFRSQQPDAKYFAYLFLTDCWRSQIRKVASGVKLYSITQKILKETSIIIPPLPEQKKIANFLDAKCADIDQIRADIEKQIEILTDYKKSIITEAVTKGLDPKAKMKDSGIKWVGKIPEHWSVNRVKYLVKKPLQYGANESGTDFDESNPRYIRITDITMDNKLKEDGKLSLEKDAAKPYILKDEDILFARSGASVGKTFFYRSFYGESAFAGYLIRASFNNSIIDPKYAYYNTLGNNYEAWKSRAFSQATIQNIGADKYNEYKLPLPPLCEQKSIINYLDEKCSEIDATIAEKQKQLETLEEYKKSLIFEYVTGKKEVV